jgi:hypothetical protein
VNDEELKNKLENLEMSEDEYINNLTILDFYDFVESYGIDLISISIRQYMKDLLNHISKKVMRYGDSYEKYFKRNSEKYLRNLHSNMYDSNLSVFKNNIESQINLVNDSYLILKSAKNNKEKIAHIKSIIHGLDDKNKRMYINLLKIKYTSDVKFKNDDIKLFDV